MASLPPRTLHATLRKITEVLADELANPSELAPDWSETEWLIARAVVSIHGVGSLLADRLRWLGPPGWAQYLAEQKSQTAKRFVRVRQLLEQIDGRSRREGVALVALKGAALYESGVYAAGERPMADIDLLVREAASEQALRVLGELGFRETGRTWKHVMLAQLESGTAPAPLGESSHNSISIELHTRAKEILPLRAVDISDLVFPYPHPPGLGGYASKAALLMHVLLHASGAMVLRCVRLLHLHDIARLSLSMADEDWREVLDKATRTEDATFWWAYPPLALTERYYHCIPDWVMTRAAADCHVWLRRACRHRTLSGASCSHLWISAFPGIEWARSPGEMLAYVRSRAVPSAETLHQRKAAARLQPRVSGGPWAQLSQGRRMLRWFLAGQVRQESLQPVLAALGEAP